MISIPKDLILRERANCLWIFLLILEGMIRKEDGHEPLLIFPLAYLSVGTTLS